MAWDVVIVGGGIGGGVLAAGLVRGGRRVLVLEAHRAPGMDPRAELLWPTTMRRLAETLGAEALGSVCVPIARVELDLGGGARHLVPETTFDRLGWRPTCADGGALREALLLRGGATVRRGARVVGLLRESGRISGVSVLDEATGARTEERARLIVGNDGPSSVVREGCGIALVGRPLDVEFRVFPFGWPGSMPDGVIRIFSDACRADSPVLQMLAMPLPARRGIGVLVSRRGRTTAGALESFFSRHPLFAETARGAGLSRAGTGAATPFGHAARYGAPGVVLLGDAAHPTPPSGAQGAGMAVSDACALLQALEPGEEGAADRYEAVRRDANERAQAFSRRCSPSWALREGRASAVLCRLGLEAALAWPGGMRRVFSRAAGTFNDAES